MTKEINVGSDGIRIIIGSITSNQNNFKNLPIQDIILNTSNDDLDMINKALESGGRGCGDGMQYNRQPPCEFRSNDTDKYCVLTS